MQDKLQKILNIKIDAINKNIDNLNYLNGELDKNNENLDYIKDKISLFKNNEILNFDQISKDDFEKILLMIDPSISDIFRSKTCSYEGIIYIIEGIRKSISLELTEEQNSAILSFIEGMRMKSLNLQDVIANLNESKNKLPETDLNVLDNTLESYENIISKLDNNLYLTEIDEIENALDFAELTIEEKADMLEYILKYNADIYITKEEKEIKEETKEEQIELPEFHYEPFDIDNNLSSEDHDIKNVEEEKMPTAEEIKINLDQMNEDLDLNKEESKEKMPTIEEIKINLDQMNEELGLNKEEMPTISDIKFNLDQMYSDLNLSEDEEKTKEITVLPEYDQSLPTEDIPEGEKSNENHELNTVELEDIIKKIDAKLKEMDNEESIESKEKSDDVLPNVEQSETEMPKEEVKDNNVDYSGIITKYSLPELKISGKSTEELDSLLTILNDNKVLDELKQDRELLSKILNDSSIQRFEDISNLIKEYLLVKKDEFDYVLDIIIKTMPILLVKNDAFESFKANLEFFKEHHINIINIFDNYRELLIMNNDVLKENYKKALMYGFEVNDDNVKYYLYNCHLIENIDLYLEAIGYEKGFLGKEERFDGLEYINKNPYKLNEINKNTLMKLRYASENNQKIYGNKPGILSGEISNPKVDILTLSDDYKKTYFNGEYSFVDPTEFLNLKEEITNLKEFDLTLDGIINKLDSSYKKDELRYKIDNILISRIKTIRLYNFLKNKNMSSKNALLVALTYNTVLKITEYDQLKAVVDAIVEGGN